MKLSGHFWERASCIQPKPAEYMDRSAARERSWNRRSDAPAANRRRYNERFLVVKASQLFANINT